MKRLSPKSRRLKHRGNSLLEVAVSTLLVSVLLVAALQAAGQSLFSQIKAADRVRGQRLARLLLIEIMQRAYSEPGATNPPIGTDSSELGRATFDDVDDYHAYGEVPPQDAAGNALAEYTGWTRSVTVEWIDPATLATAAGESGAKRITVSTSLGGAPVAAATGYRTSAP